MQILKEKSRAKSQITFDEDFNVPDAKPDVGRLIQYKGRISMDDVHLADGKLSAALRQNCRLRKH